MNLFFLSSFMLLATASGIKCAVYSSTNVVESVTRNCVDSDDVLNAGAGVTTPCNHDCGADVEFCFLATNRQSGMHTARCGENYIDAFGVCTEKVCLCISDREGENVGECNSATRFLVTPMFTALLVFISTLILSF